jgi:hypothetical protein
LRSVADDGSVVAADGTELAAARFERSGGICPTGF